MKTKALKFALSLLLALGVMAPMALQGQTPQSSEVLFKAGYAEIIYDPEYIPTLGLKVGIKTLILLPSDERIVRVESGVRGTAIEIKYGVNWVAIRPNIDRLSTNLHIPTDQGRVYTFNLIEGGGPHKEPHQKVVVVRPDMELDADGGPSVSAPTGVQAQQQLPRQGQLQAPQQMQAPAQPVQQERPLPAVVGMDDDGGAPVQLHKGGSVPGAEVLRKLDDDYKISNQKAKVFEVKRVYNDGSRTFVVFKTAMSEAPLFYRINPGGKREILTYRMDPGKDPRDMDVSIIPRLVDKGTVKVVDYESTFTWRRAE